MSFFSSLIASAQECDSASMMAKRYFEQKDYDKAAIEIQRAIYFGCRDVSTYELASQIFDKLGSSADADFFRTKALSLQNISERDSVIKPRNKKLACWLSAAVPGAGQYYSGNIKQGLSSQLVTGSATAISLLLFNYYKPFTALFSTIPLCCRFYAGGIINAGKCADGKLGH